MLLTDHPPLVYSKQITPHIHLFHSFTCSIVRSLPTQTLPMESISRRHYHKKLYSPMQIFYHGVYLIFLSYLLLPLY
jgi:hypothetical protein